MNRLLFRISLAALLALIAPILAAAELTPKQLANRARAAFSAGQLGEGYALLQSAEAAGPNADVLLAEAEITLNLGFPRVAFSSLDDAEKLAPDDTRLVPLRVRIQQALKSDASVEKPYSALLAPSVAAIEAGNAAKAEDELVRAYFAARCFDAELKFSSFLASRAFELGDAGKTAAAFADYRRSFASDFDAQRAMDFAKLLMRTPVAPGTPEAGQVAALLAKIDPAVEYYPEVIWRRGQLWTLHYPATHDFDELVAGAIDLTLARRLYSEAPVPPNINVALAQAIAALAPADRARLQTQVRTKVGEQTLVLVSAWNTDSPYHAADLDLLLRELIQRDPSNAAAWAGRAKLCEDTDLKPVLDFIVSQFHPDPAVPLSSNRDVAAAQQWLRQRPYAPQRYAIAFQRLTSDSKSTNDYRNEFYYQAICLLAPDSLLQRQTELVHKAWKSGMHENPPKPPAEPLAFPPVPDAEEEAKIVALAPDNPELRLWYLKHLKTRHQSTSTSLAYDEKAPLLDILLARYPRSVPLTFERGQVARSEFGRTEEALTYFKRTYELNPSDNAMAEFYADRLRDGGKYPEAVQVYRHLLGPGPVVAGEPLYIKLAVALTGANDASAVTLMNEAMDEEINPEWVQGLLDYTARTAMIEPVTTAMRGAAKKAAPKPAAAVSQ